MLEMNKRIDENGYYTFSFKTINGTFEITFQNNLDLYWRYNYYNNINEEPDAKEFLITKENYQIYSLFEELYNSIKDSNPYSGYTFITPIRYYHKEYEKDEPEKIEIPENPHPNYLYKDGIITWCSDDFSSLEKASNFRIEQLEDAFKIAVAIYGKNNFFPEEAELPGYYDHFHVNGRTFMNRYSHFHIWCGEMLK